MLQVTIDDKVFKVTKKQYIHARTIDLQRFGYETLTEKEFSELLESVLRGEEQQDVVGVFIKRDKPTLV